MKNTPDVADFIRAYDEWAKSEELCGGELFDEMLRQRDLLDAVSNVQKKGDQFRDELTKATRQRDAMVEKARWYAESCNPMDYGIEVAKVILAAGEAAKEENDGQ